jgi:murein DD-endopeptidase MepM/ murein hydrolase activator NlpD
MTSSTIIYDSSLFHPVVRLPAGYRVYDLTKGPAPDRKAGEYGVGRYNEKRPGMYSTELFSGVRDIHLGIDLSAPAGTPVHAFHDGEILSFAYNSAAGDYGYTIITEHRIGSTTLYALHGHLSARSIQDKKPGQRFSKGDVIAWIGEPHENGGWPEPHLHFQLSWEKPEKCDMPGVVSQEQLHEALKKHPDPRIVLGPLY